MSYTLVDSRFSVGAEIKFNETDAHGSRGTFTDNFYLGPSIQYRPIDRMHVDFVPLIGLTHETPALQAYVIIGWEFLRADIVMLDTSEPIYSDELTDLAAAIEPRPTQPSHAKRAALVVKTGRLTLSPGAVAWICSISIHAAVFDAGIWIVTSLVHHARLPIDWGGGGGSSGGLVSGQTQSQIAAVPLSGVPPAPVDPVPDHPRPEITADAEFQTDLKTSLDLGADASIAGATIGTAATSYIGQPHFNGHRPSPAGSSRDTYKSDSASTASSDPGYPRLRDASLKAAEQLRPYKLTPAVKGGKPFAEVIVIPYKFKLR